MRKAWVLSYPLSTQRRLWSDWVDAQADLSLLWAHSHFVGFVMAHLIFQNEVSFEMNKFLFKQWQISHCYKCEVLHVRAVDRLSHHMTKPTKWHVHPSKTQISRGIRPVWSDSSLSAWRKLGSLATHWAQAKTLIRLDSVGCASA